VRRIVSRREAQALNDTPLHDESPDSPPATIYLRRASYKVRMLIFMVRRVFMQFVAYFSLITRPLVRHAHWEVGTP